MSLEGVLGHCLAASLMMGLGQQQTHGITWAAPVRVAHSGHMGRHVSPRLPVQHMKQQLLVLTLGLCAAQVGCAMNCQFCFTGRMGLLGNLNTAQIVEQVCGRAPAALCTTRLCAGRYGGSTHGLFPPASLLGHPLPTRPHSAHSASLCLPIFCSLHIIVS